MESLHPHPDKQHLLTTYRRHILSAKKRYGTARSLVHYRKILQIYLAAKRDIATKGHK